MSLVEICKRAKVSIEAVVAIRETNKYWILTLIDGSQRRVLREARKMRG